LLKSVQAVYYIEDNDGTCHEFIYRGFLDTKYGQIFYIDEGDDLIISGYRYDPDYNRYDVTHGMNFTHRNLRKEKVKKL
jgi:hypothetical protein